MEMELEPSVPWYGNGTDGSVVRKWNSWISDTEVEVNFRLIRSDGSIVSSNFMLLWFRRDFNSVFLSLTIDMAEFYVNCAERRG